MSTIELDALDAFMQASDVVYSMSARDVVAIIRRLDEAGWQLTRKPEPIVEVATQADPWPPLGVSQKLWAAITPGGLEFIEIKDEIVLRAAVAINRTIFEAATLAEAERYWKNPDLVRRDWFEYAGTKFDFMTDQIPF